MQDFNDWLGRLYNRPSIENHLDRTAPGTVGSSEVMADIWDAPIMRDFKGHDGKPFFRNARNEGRLAFSLNMDGFNPFTNKQAGKQISSCGIYLVCLNLPPELRYRPENVFLVGVIPGPSEPSLHQINYILKPLVDDFLAFWKEGVYLMCTYKHPSGRKIKAAIIPLVCDLPAARKMAGMGSHMFHLFCSECLLPLREIENLDFTQWPRRSCDEHRAAAIKWKTASSSDAQRLLFLQNGIRWSELLRLPYWDPTSFVVIDTMHCFFLGLFRCHVNDVWGMSVGTPDGLGPSFQTKMKEPTETEMNIARKAFSGGHALKNLHHHVLVALCRELGLRFAGWKVNLLKRLDDVFCFLVVSVNLSLTFTLVSVRHDGVTIRVSAFTGTTRASGNATIKKY